MDGLAKMRRLTKRRHEIETAWREEVRLAARTHTTRAVGAAAGITHARVVQIVHEASAA